MYETRTARRRLLEVAVLASLLAAPGRAQTLLAQVLGPDPVAPLGDAVALVGDVDGDGVSDLLLGLPRSWGSLGMYQGRAQVHSGATGALIRVHWGARSYSQFGTSLTDLGDVDGDGVADYAVGAPGEGLALGASPSGRVRIFSGSSGSRLLGVDGMSIGLPGGESFGWALCGPGDLDGDGIPDFAVGAPGPLSGISPSPGTVAACSGASGAVLWLVFGNPYSDFGWSLAGPGDLNGDGIPDVVAGAPANGYAALGLVRALSGPTGSTIWTSTGVAALGYQLGYSLDGTGDVTGDGVFDVLAGAPLAPLGANQSGFVEVLSGATGASVLFLAPPGPAFRFGSVVSGVGDVDADGVPDAAVATAFGAPTWTPPPSTHLYSLASGSVIQSLVLPGNRTPSMDGGADLNGDAVPDLLVGRPNTTSTPGPAYSIWGRVEAFGLPTGTLLFSIPGSGTGESSRFGEGLAAAGDLNGDGVSDLFVGSPRGLPFSGAAGSFFGNVQSRLLSTGSTLWTVPGPTPGSDFGAGVYSIGDVNGDGKLDLASWGISPSAPPVLSVLSGPTAALIHNVVAPPTAGLSEPFVASPAGDVDQDGLGDFAVTWYPSFQVTVHSGASGLPIVQVTGVPLVGPFSMDGGEDLDGNGTFDLVIGDPGAGVGGTIWIVSLPTGTLAQSITGAVPGALGWAAAIAGDVDHDGFLDILAGAPFHGAVPGMGFGPGRAYLFSGATGLPLQVWDGPPGMTWFGRTVATGDVSGDGTSDAIVASALPTAPVLRVDVLSGATGAPLDSIVHTDPQAGFGLTLAPAGFVDAGASEDFAVGARLAFGTGAVYVYASAAGGLQGFRDRGGESPGTGGVRPMLQGYGSLFPNGTVTLALHRGAPGATGTLLLSAGSVNVPAFGGLIVASSALALVCLPLAINPGGSWSSQSTIAAGAPAGSVLFAQVGLSDPGSSSGIALSNALEIVFA